MPLKEETQTLLLGVQSGEEWNDVLAEMQELKAMGRREKKVPGRALVLAPSWQML